MTLYLLVDLSKKKLGGEWKVRLRTPTILLRFEGIHDYFHLHRPVSSKIKFCYYSSTHTANPTILNQTVKRVKFSDLLKTF